MLVNFSKMQGLGNDFMVIDNVTQNVYLPNDQIKKLADRNFGVGFDQLLVVEPPYDPDLDFHYRIIKGSKNAHLIHLLCNDLYQLIRMYRVQMGMVGPRVSKAFDEHLAIINAIENHDGELAEMLMKRHISASQANIQTKFDLYQSE